MNNVSRAERLQIMLTDEELMRSYQNGDEQAFRALFGRYAGRIYAYLLNYTGSRSLAEDLTRRMPSRAAAVRELLKRGLSAEGFAIADGRTKSKEFGMLGEGEA